VLDEVDDAALVLVRDRLLATLALVSDTRPAYDAVLLANAASFAVGAFIVLPFIAGYTLLSYRIFRGKAAKKLYD